MTIKQTIIVGTKNGELNCAVMRGHWSLESVKSNAVRRGVILKRVKHSTLDATGKGRSGVDRILFGA